MFAFLLEFSYYIRITSILYTYFVLVLYVLRIYNYYFIFFNAFPISDFIQSQIHKILILYSCLVYCLNIAFPKAKISGICCASYYVLSYSCSAVLEFLNKYIFRKKLIISLDYKNYTRRATIVVIDMPLNFITVFWWPTKTKIVVRYISTDWI